MEVEREKSRQPSQRRLQEDALFKDWLQTYAKHDDTGEPPGPTSPEPDSLSEMPAAASALQVTPREYQYELFERAKKKNTIVVLDTGSGKTLIAIMLLRHMLEQELEDRANGKIRKTAFFVVDNITLCMQQHSVIRANLPFTVAMFYGGTQPIQQEQSYWDTQFEERMIIVCTAQILLDCLDNGFINMGRINLLIFDEVHHAKKNHPYASIMKRHYLRCGGAKPRILGLTASPVDTQNHDLQASAEQLEGITCSEIVTVSDSILQATWVKQDQAEPVRYYSPLKGNQDSSTHLTRQIEEYAQRIPQLNPCVLQAKEIASQLGLWSADYFWQMLLTDTTMQGIALQSGKQDSLDFSYHNFEAASDSLASLRPLLSHHQLATLLTDEDAISSKLLLLRQILWEYFEKSRSTRCIVFVRTKSVAIILAAYFNQPNVAPPGMIGDFMVGLGKSSSFNSLSQQKRFQRLEDLRHGETNCLFATSVAEEGLDIPACDLVIRFDICSSAIQYIQSRGRARKASSVYLTMMERDNIQQYRRYLDVIRTAQDLRRFCQSLPEDRKIETYKPPHENEFIVADTAVLSKQNSMNVLAKFVSSLGQGTNRNPTPDYMVSGAGSNFVSWVILPDTAPLRSTTGSIETSKIRARSAAAYEACVSLIEMGYINKNLQPTFKKKLPKMRNARLALSSKKQTEYSMLIKPRAWTALPPGKPTELFATFINLNPRRDGTTPIALLTRNTLPEIGPTRLFVAEGIEMVADLVPGGPVHIPSEQLELLSAFTLLIFGDVFNKCFGANPEELPFYVAPYLSNLYQDGAQRVVDWVMLERIALAKVRVMEEGGDRLQQQRFVFDPFDQSRRFIINQVNASLRPTDPTPDGVPQHKCRGYQSGEKTIVQYSCSAGREKRRKLEFDTEQPVYDATLLSLRRNFLTQADIEDHKPEKPCHITLQHLRVSAVPADIARGALLLPSILHRLDTALVVSEACDMLGLNIPILLAMEAFTKNEVNADQEEEVLENEQQGIPRNYERLEFLGDTFLKMATTIALYTQNTTASEFDHHVERMLLVCNRNLFNTALGLDLQKYIRSGGFDRRTWYPNLRLLQGKQAKSVIMHSLADKTIADVCEAVIGAAYISSPNGSMDEAVKAVTKFTNSENHAMSTFADYYAGFSVPSWHLKEGTAGVRATVDRIADATGYRFRAPLLLRSAFTHPSYLAEDIPNYQTLEFLGDALLDMAVVDYLFRQHPDAGPQWLTEHKMAVCSNQFLGCLCIELNLQHEILTTDAQVPGQIICFKEKLQYLKSEAVERADKTGQPAPRSCWTLATNPPKLLADVVEALLGAMFVDSQYNYDVVRAFFQRFIQPYLDDMSGYDTLGPGHIVTQAIHHLQNHHRCRRGHFYVSEVPCESRTGIMALTESDCVCALQIHGVVRWHAKADSGIEAKSKVAALALAELQGMDRDYYRELMKCDCDGA